MQATMNTDFNQKVLEIYDELDKLNLEELDIQIDEIKEGLKKLAEEIEEETKEKDRAAAENFDNTYVNPLVTAHPETKPQIIKGEGRKLMWWEKALLAGSAVILVILLALVIYGICTG